MLFMVYPVKIQELKGTTYTKRCLHVQYNQKDFYKGVHAGKCSKVPINSAFFHLQMRRRSFKCIHIEF